MLIAQITTLYVKKSVNLLSGSITNTPYFSVLYYYIGVIIMLETFIELADYVWDFYAPNSDLYPIKGLTMDEVYAAIFEYKQRLLKVSYNNPEYVKAFGNNYTYGYGDSLDRERVRDILLENPNLSWS